MAFWFCATSCYSVVELEDVGFCHRSLASKEEQTIREPQHCYLSFVEGSRKSVEALAGAGAGGVVS